MDRKRLILLALGIFSLFSILIAQFYRIQLIQGEKWASQAKRQHFFTVTDPFMRGSFFSNVSVQPGNSQESTPLVVDIQKFHLFIDPEAIPEGKRDVAAQQICALLKGTSYEEIRGQFDVKSRSRRLVMWLDREQMEKVQNWWQSYSRLHRLGRNALFFVSDYQRSYPFGKCLGQVLHTVQHQRDEVTKQAIPTGGLELSMHAYLVGKQGQRSLMRSPRNNLETGEVVSLPENGADIFLTINHVLQTIAEEEIEKGVKEWEAKRGWAVMMNPFTGEIYALAQYPFFNPADYTEFFNDPDMIEHTRVHAIVDANEPGSTMKPITVAIALKANEVLAERKEKPLFSITEKMATFNIPFKGRKKMLHDTRRHDFLNMPMAIQKSSNVYMARLVDRILDRLGADWYRNMLTETFGFSHKTHIELPAESAGVVPMPGKKHPNGRLEWSVPTPYSLAFGHNLQTTSLQVVRAHAILANGGYTVQPTLIRKVVKNGEVLLDNTPNFKPGRQVLSKAIVDEVVRAMKYITKPGGTSPSAEIWGYTEVGKSGTAEKVENGAYSKTKYFSTFVGFTPVSKPAFVLLVSLDEPKYGFKAGVGKQHHGGISVSPIFRDIAKRALEYLGVAPDDPYGYHVDDPRYDAAKADWKKEVTELRELYAKWNSPQ